MAHKIQVKRGDKADLPTLDAGEFGLCQDTNELFIGNDGNQKIFPTEALRTARFVIGTSTAGWTAAECDYLCDGTNDQEEIIQALNALPATGGEVVILDGTYNIKASINIPKDNVSIRGSGNATTLKRMYNSTNTDSGATAKGLITLNGKSGCKIQGLQIDGNKATYTASYNYGIYLSSSSSDNTVTGNTCNNNSYGIRLYSSSDNTVTGNTCNNNSYGIYLSSSSNNTVTGNTCNNNNNGIYLFSSNNNTVIGNTCNNNSYGIRLYSSSNNNTVTGNTCNNNNSYGICLYSSSDNTVTGNTCNNNNYGIYLSSSSNNTITCNTCVRGTGLATDYTASQHTIQLYGTSNSYNLISNNNCMGKAVTNGGGTGNTLVNNKFDDSDDIQALADIVSTNVGDLETLTTTDKSSLVGAVNEVDSHSDTNATAIGTLASLTTTEKTNLVGAVNELNIDKIETSAITNTLTETGTGKVLDARQGKTLSDKIGTQTYTEQNYITDAESVTASLDALDMQLNETQQLVSTNVGDLETLTTTDKSSLVNATNEVKNLVDTNKTNITAHDQKLTNIEMRFGTYDIVDTGDSPGNVRLLAGKPDAGFFGFVQPSEMGLITANAPGNQAYSGANLALALGLSDGTAFNSDVPLMKFHYKGKVLFVPLTGYRYNLSWDALYAKGIVFDTADEGFLPPAGRCGINLTIDANDNSINCTTQNFLGDKSADMDYADTVGAVGDTLVLKGWANESNNATVTISSITNTKIIVTGAALVSESGGKTSRFYNTKNAVTQGKTVEIGDKTYKVYLPCGAGDNPTDSYSDADRGAAGANNMWNSLILPLHEHAKLGNWNYPAYAVDASGTKITADWGFSLTDADLRTHNSHGSGSYTWCQENLNTSSWRRVYRGNVGASHLYGSHSWNSSSYSCWRPVLESL